MNHKKYNDSNSSSTSNSIRNSTGTCTSHSVDGQNLAPLLRVNLQQAPHPVLNIGKKPWQEAGVRMATILQDPDAHGYQHLKGGGVCF